MKIKLIKIFILIITILLLFNNYQVFAMQDSGGGNTSGQLKDIKTDFYKPKELTKDDYSNFTTKVKKVIGIINVVGIIFSVLILCVIGLRYMLGSVEEKAEYKKTAIGYLIGAFLVFSVTTIPNILYNIGLLIGKAT